MDGDYDDKNWQLVLFLRFRGKIDVPEVYYCGDDYLILFVTLTVVVFDLYEMIMKCHQFGEILIMRYCDSKQIKGPSNY